MSTPLLYASVAQGQSYSRDITRRSYVSTSISANSSSKYDKYSADIGHVYDEKHSDSVQEANPHLSSLNRMGIDGEEAAAILGISQGSLSTSAGENVLNVAMEVDGTCAGELADTLLFEFG